MNELLKPGQALEIVRANYPLKRVQDCTLVRRGFNDHYLVCSGNAQYILRIYLNHKYYIQSPDAFQFELDLLEHLRSDGVPVANALRTNDGELLGWVPTSHGDRAFALFPYAPGGRTDRDSITKEQSFQLGKAMADIHMSANNFHSELKRYHLDLAYLVDEPIRLIQEKIDGAESALTSDEEKDELRSILESMGPIGELVEVVKGVSLGQDEFGIIHGDMNTGNVHFNGNELIVFDFDHCAYGWRAYDLSISLFLAREKRDAMLRGYQSRRSLSKKERESLPVFSKLRRLWDIGDMIATENLREEV